MVVRGGIFAAGVLAAMAGVGPSSAQEAGGQPWSEYEMEARIWLDRGAEPVLQNGERVRVYYRVSEDAHVAIFHIDTDGVVRLVFPRAPRENQIVVGARDYRVLFPETSYWFVDEFPGMGYFFIVAAPEPLDLSTFEYSYHDGGWDLSRVSRQVYGDPYQAVDDYVAALIPEWQTTPYALDFVAYNVGDVHEYPRFLCYDCHTFAPYNAWNPYYYACTSYRVVVYDDPVYYPSRRYGGEGVVYPAQGSSLPRYTFKERAQGEPGYPLLATRGQMLDGLDRLQERSTTVQERGVASRLPGGEPNAQGRTGRELDDGRTPLPVIVPWPGRTDRVPRPGPATRSSVTGREVPTAGAVPSSSLRPPRTQTREPDRAVRGRPVLEPRTPNPESRSRGRSFWERLIPARFRGSGGDASPSSDRVPSGGAVRPSSGGRTRDGAVRPQPRRPSGGDARPTPGSPPRGGAARPTPRRPSGGSSSPPPTPSRRRGGGGG